MEEVDGNNESKKRRRNLSTIIEEEYDFTTSIEKKSYKRIILSIANPSYLLGLGAYNLRPENRARSCHFLRKLVRQHNLTEASGLLSILLKGTCKDSNPTMNRFKYLVAMEFIKHLETDGVDLITANGIYDVWMTRIGINLSSKRKGNVSMKEENFVVRLESILFRLMQGNIEGERQNARSLMQESEFDDHPLFNMIVGLILFQLCYSNIPEEMQWKDSDKIHSPTCTDLPDTPSQLDMSATRFRYEAGGSEGHNALFNDESKSSFPCGSETSVMNCKEMSMEVKKDLHKELESMEVDANLQRNVPQDFPPQGFYANSAENEVSVDNNGGHMHFIPNWSALKSWNSWLLPLQIDNWESEWVIQDDEYNHAVMYLQAAICSTPPLLAALIPLIQLLLIKCKHREALDELEKFCGNSNAALPNRLRAHILERVDPNNTVVLSTCFEDTLKMDPTCRDSLDKLISLHQKGNYSPESLLEMIALHLEAVFGEDKIWREFALCFLKVSKYEEDCMSVLLHGNKGEKMQGYSVRYNRIPNLFIRGKSGRRWRFRCRWWLTRHFSKNLLASEIDAGNLEVLTYKAASAAYLYGPEFDYVVKACACLEKENNRSLFKFLKLHLHNCIGINLHFQQRTN